MLSISSCVDEAKYKSQISDHKKTIAILTDSIEKLKDTPEQLILLADDLWYKKDTLVALKYYNEIVSRFPLSKYNGEAKTKSSDISKAIRKAKEEASRIKALGFKAAKISTKITIGDVTMSFSDIKFSNRFTFDHQGDEWMFRQADKDSKYLLLDVRVKSENMSPDIPYVYAYVLNDEGNLKQFRVFNDEYHSWSSYGTKIGLYHENRHDFSKVSSVRFDYGTQIPKNIKSDPIFIIVTSEIGISTITLKDVIGSDVIKIAKILNY